MWEIGEELGWDRPHTEDVGMLLVSLGLVEIKTLSGAMGLTDQGVAAAGSVSAPTSSASSDGPDLKSLAEKIESAASNPEIEANIRNNLVVDAGVLRLQADRNGILPGVVQGVLTAVKDSLAGSKSSAGNLGEEIDRALAAYR